MKRQLHLWAFLQGIGHYPSGWRHANAAPRAVFDLDYYREIGRMIEGACFDAIVFGDQLQARGANGHTPGRLAIPTLDPITLLAAIGGVTRHVGLVATVSTTYNSAAAIADRFATLDRLSGGRAGWNIVTTAHPESAWNFGDAPLPEKSRRYAHAEEVVAAACTHWADATRPLPQGRPVLVQAGQSGDGRNFAAGTADAIFCPAARLEDGQVFRADIHARMRALGRDPAEVRVMPGLSFVLESSEAAAIAKDEALLALADQPLCIEYLGESLGYDLSRHDPDGPIPLDAILAGTELPPADVARVLERPVAEGARLGSFAATYIRTPRGHHVFRGTPEQMADMMEHWITAEACDGFTLQPAYMPGELRLFAEQVVPILQRRGLLRSAYPGATLRETLGLATA